MLPWRHLPRWIALLLAAWALAGRWLVVASEKELLPAVDDQWRHFRSPHFELYSRQDESDSRELLQHLELLRAVFFERFNFVERAKLEVTVYAFRRAEDFRAYAPPAFTQANFKGFYHALPDRAVICLAPLDEGVSAARLVYHEYVHHLFRAADETPTVWFNEGMAELLASLREERGNVEIGHPHAGLLQQLQQEKLLALETLFAVDYRSPVYASGHHTGLFYAEAWALLHYLYCGESNLPKEAIARFTHVAADQKSAAATDLRQLFRECFGFDYPEMERRLQDYVTLGRYRYSRQPAPKIDPPASYAMRVVPRDEIRVRLAELGLRVTRSGAAKLVLLDAVARGAKDPRLFEVLGADAMLEHDEAKAQERWEEALAAGSANPAIVRELGLLESRTWFQQFDFYFRLPPETVDRLRSRLTQAIEHEPQQAAPYEMLAWVEAFAAAPKIQNVNLVQQHFPVVKQKQRTVLALALVRLHAGMTDDAKVLLAGLDKLEPDPWTAHAAEIVRARMDGRPATTAVPRPVKAPGKVQIRIAPPKPPVSLPPIELPGKP